jgi:hypothetical protein
MCSFLIFTPPYVINEIIAYEWICSKRLQIEIRTPQQDFP